MSKDKCVRLLGRITSVYIYVLITVFLLFARGYGAISRAKFAMFLVVCGVYIIACLGVLAAGIRGFDRKAFRPTAPAVLMAVFIAVTWLSAVLSPYWPETVIGASRFEGALSITVYALCFILVSAFGRADRAHLICLGASVSAFCLLSAAQLQGYNPFGLYPQGYSYLDRDVAYHGAYIGTIGNVDLAAAFLSLVIPILLYSVVRLEGRLRFALLIPLALAAYVLVGIDVSAGFMGAGLGVILSVPVAWARGERLRRGMFIALAALVAVALLTVFSVDMGSGPLHEAHQVLHGNFDMSFGSGRLKIWGEVARALDGRLLLGAGPDTMIYGGLEGFARYDAQRGLRIIAQIDVAHNEYLNILYHQGVFALGAYLGALFLLAKGWLRAAPGNPGAAVLGAGVLGYCIQAFFSFSVCITAPFFWTALGLLAGCIMENKKPLR